MALLVGSLYYELDSLSKEGGREGWREGGRKGWV